MKNVVSEKCLIIGVLSPIGTEYSCKEMEERFGFTRVQANISEINSDPKYGDYIFSRQVGREKVYYKGQKAGVFSAPQ